MLEFLRGEFMAEACKRASDHQLASAIGSPVVVVTGGSRGIGLALARGFAARGHNQFLIARDSARLRAAAGNIQSDFGVVVRFAAHDLALPEATAEIVATLAAEQCHADILVNCAGIGIYDDFIVIDKEQAHRVLAVNIAAATNLMHAWLPGMLQRRRGGVLNVASLAGLTPMPYLALYAASKSYLIALTRAGSTETSGSGVTVSVVLPGPVNTDFLSNSSGASVRRAALLPGLSAETVARTAIEGFLAGQTVITPGLVGTLCRLALKLTPYWLLAPVIKRAAKGAFFGSAPKAPTETVQVATCAANVSPGTNYAVAGVAQG